MGNMLKIVIGTFLALEILAIITHFGELVDYVGSVFSAVLPVFIIFIGIVWMIKSIIK